MTTLGGYSTENVNVKTLALLEPTTVLALHDDQEQIHHLCK